jgi:hypothetical protein
MEEMAIKSKKEPYSLRLDKALIKALEREAVKQNRSVANLIDTILIEYFAEKKGGKK